MTFAIRESDGWSTVSSTDLAPAYSGIEPVCGLWPCKSDSAARPVDQLKPAPEVFRQLEEAWRHAVP